MSGARSPTAGRRVAPVAALVLGALQASTGSVAAQGAPLAPSGDGLSVLLDALGGALVSLVVCGLLLLIARPYVERTTDRVFEQPGTAFVYGLGLVLAGLVLAVLLTITIVGVLLVVPLVLSALVFGQLGYLAAARVVADDPRLVLVVAVGIGALTAGVPVLGGLVGFALVCVGIGAWYLDYRADGPTGAGGDAVGFDFDTGEGRGSSTPLGEATGETGSDGDGGRRSGDASGPAGAAAGTNDRDPGPGDPDSGSADRDPDPGDEWTAGFEDELDGE